MTGFRGIEAPPQRVLLLVLSLAVAGGAGFLRNRRARRRPSVATDRRLAPLKNLDGEFLFQPITSPEAWRARSAELRRQLQVALGLWPMPEATPLNAVVHGAVAATGYTVEKVYFESLPGHFVTGSLYRPTGRQGRLPAVLLPHGHWEHGRYMETPDKEFKHELVTGAERFDPGGRHPLQAAPAQLAKMGVIAFLFDLEGYADSVQIPSARRARVERTAEGLPRRARALLPRADRQPASVDHGAAVVERAPRAGLPRQPAGRRSVADRRQRRERRRHADVHPRRARPAARDVFFPMVMVGTRMQGGCTCENADYLRVGTGNVEIASLMAPRPLGMTTADDWTKTMPETGFRRDAGDVEDAGRRRIASRSSRCRSSITTTTTSAAERCTAG